MSGKKKINLQSPDFFQDPSVRQGINSLTDLGGRLSSFDFSGSLSPLADTIALDPEITKLALQQAQLELGPAFEDTLNQIKQEAVASNQFESSTFGDALAREGGRLNQQFQAITTGAALDDRVRALASRLGLVELGGNLTAQGTQAGLVNQSQRNEFEQRNFENKLAIETFNRSNRGGLFGGLTGAIGGGIGGFALGGPVGAAVGAVGGGLAGGLGPSGTGGQLLNAGSSLAAFNLPTNNFDIFRPTTTAGKSAFNTADLFGGVGDNDTSKLVKQLQLFG